MLRKLLPHGAIIISGMYFVFFIIDRVNSPMAFINNDITKALLFVLCEISVVNALLLIRDDRRRTRQQQERPRQAGGRPPLSEGYRPSARYPRSTRYAPPADRYRRYR